MKNLKKFLFLLLIFLPLTLLSGCTTTTNNVAKDLDTTITNFTTAVSNLDWPTDTTLEELNSVLTQATFNQNNASDTNSVANTTSTAVLIDTGIDTSEIYTWLESVHSKINIMLSKRSDILVYINEMYSNNTNLNEEDLLAIKVYMNVIKDNANYLSSYNGMLNNQINEAKNLLNNNQNTNVINAYIIKAVETLQIRCAKIDTSILAMNSIIDIISKNLINNYFDYNQHNIEDNTQSEDNSLENDSNTQENNTQDNNQTIQDEIDVPTEDIPAEDNQEQIEELENSEQNAINFDSQEQQVELQENDTIEEVNNQTQDNEEPDSTNEEESSEIPSTLELHPEDNLINEENSIKIDEINNNKAKPLDKDKEISREIHKEKLI